MHSNKGNGSRAACAGGFMAFFATAADGARLDCPAGGGGAVRVCREWRFQHCVGDRHGHKNGGGHGRGGECAPDGIAVTPDGTHVYVANSSSDTVSVIATATNTVVGLPIPVGVIPEGWPSPRTGQGRMSQISPPTLFR